MKTTRFALTITDSFGTVKKLVTDTVDLPNDFTITVTMEQDNRSLPIGFLIADAEFGRDYSTKQFLKSGDKEEN